MKDLTNTKLAALEQEYDNLQHYLQTREDRGLYSANKQRNKESNALITIGYIKHLLRHNTNRKFNRKLAGFQYYKLTGYIEYKAALAGIKVIQVSQKWTSQYCRKCYRKGVRKIQGLFRCSKRGEDNADRNAAFNIGHRGLGHASNLGIIVSVSRTFPSIDRNAMMKKEATDFNRW